MQIDCPHFGPCSGCILSKKVNEPPILETIRKELGSVPLRLEKVTGWRTKAKLAVRPSCKAALHIGLFRAGTHDVLEIPHCQVHHPAINRAVAALSQVLREEGISAYNETTGLLRYIQCLVDLKTEKIQLTLVWNAAPQTPFMVPLLNRLYELDLWHSIWFNFQPALTNRIFGDTWHHCFGPPLLWQTLGPLQIPFHPAAFSQAHWTLFEKLAHEVVSWIPLESHLVEFYAGVGAMGLLAAPRCQSVHLIESNPFSQLSFQSIQVPSHVHYHSLDANHALSFLQKATCILVDPPRKGLDPILRNALKEWAGTLLYVSCDFASFLRDAKELQAAGFKLKQTSGYLLFPGTDHVELIAMFTRS